MAFHVKSTARTKRSLRAILSWLQSQHAGDSGLRWFEGLQSAIASLSENPYRCALILDDDTLSGGVRQLLYGNKPHVYCILFAVKGDTVTVLDIRHGRRLRKPAS